MDNFDEKPLDSIRGIVQDKLSMILFNKNDTTKYKLVGSSAYRLNKYYGDLDILEEVTANNSSTLIDTVIKNLKRVIADIKKKRVNYLTDFKAGIDSRYSFPIFISKKSSSNGIIIKNADTVIKSVELLTKKKLIPSDISKQILNILSIPDAVSISDYYFIKDYFRKASTVRWTYQEIMAGKKSLARGATITLKEALRQRTLVKLDYVTTLGDQFIEVTNFLVLGVVKGNKVIPFNMPEYTLLRDLRLDVDKFLFTSYLYDPFKAVKRMFNISRILWNMDKDIDRVEEYMDRLIAKLLKSDVSFLSKLQSGLAPMSLLIEKGYAIPKIAFKKHLDLISFDIPNCSLLSTSDIDTINNMFDKIYKALDKKGSSKSTKNKVMNLINELNDYMQKNINYFTASYIRNKGYGERSSLALFLPKNSVSTGIIDEVPFQKDDVDFIVQTGTGNYPVDIIEIPQDADLVIPIKNVNISPTFQSLASDLESFDILGEKQEEEVISPTEIVTDEKIPVNLSPSEVISSDLLDTELPPDYDLYIQANTLTDQDIEDMRAVLEYQPNTLTDQDIEDMRAVLEAQELSSNIMSSSVPSDVYPSYIEEPDDALPIIGYNSKNEQMEDEGPLVEEINTDDDNPIDTELLEELLGPLEMFDNGSEYLAHYFNMILGLYPDYIKKLIGKRKFKNKAAEKKYLFNKIMTPIVSEIMSRY